MIRYYKIPLLIIIACIVTMCVKTDPNGYINYDESMGNPTQPNITGKGGSMARFNISDNTLYVLRDNSVLIYDITTPNETELKTEQPLDFGMETIFTYDSLVFFGSQMGMYVYSKPTEFTLEYLTNYTHITSCDPVVFDGTHAFITLNSDSRTCNRGVNELDVIDLTNLTNPILKTTYPMISPKGLGVDGDLLFVCDKNTLLIYDKSNVMQIEKIAEFDAIDAYDVIPYNGNLILTGANGIAQYSYNTTSKTIELLSSILVEN